MAHVSVFARSNDERDGVKRIEVKQKDPVTMIVETKDDHLTLFLDDKTLEVLCEKLNHASASNAANPDKPAPPVPW